MRRRQSGSSQTNSAQLHAYSAQLFAYSADALLTVQRAL